MTSQQAGQLSGIALSTAAQLQQQDAKAAAVIRAWKPAANLKPGDKPAPPAELATLQQGRQDILQAAQKQLAGALGTDAFTRLDQALVSMATTKPVGTNQSGR